MHTSKLIMNITSRKIRAGRAQKCWPKLSERIHKQRHTAYQQHMQQQHEHTLVTFTTRASTIVARGPRSPFDTSPARHVARHASAHASLAAACMQLLLPPACNSCCRLHATPAAACMHPKGPRPHTLRTFINGFALWKRPFVVTPSTTLPRPSAGCALDAATMDGSTGGMGPAPNTAPKASPPAAKATPKPSAACYEATELAIRLA
jgi:hypothetical protein